MIEKYLFSLNLIFFNLSLFGQINYPSIFHSNSKDYEYFQISFLDVPPNEMVQVQFFSKNPLPPSSFKLHNLSSTVCYASDDIYIEVPKRDLSRISAPYLFMQLYIDNKYHNYKIVATQSERDTTYFLLNLYRPAIKTDLPVQSFSKKMYYFEKNNSKRYALMEFNPKTNSKQELLKVKIEPGQSINFLKIRGNHIFYGGFDDNNQTWFTKTKWKSF